MNWKITFYNKKVKFQALAFPKGILANFLRSLELLKEFGPHIGMPHETPNKEIRLAQKRMKEVAK
jgi:hypothetical protein